MDQKTNMLEPDEIGRLFDDRKERFGKVFFDHVNVFGDVEILLWRRFETGNVKIDQRRQMLI